MHCLTMAILCLKFKKFTAIFCSIVTISAQMCLSASLWQSSGHCSACCVCHSLSNFCCLSLQTRFLLHSKHLILPFYSPGVFAGVLVNRNKPTCSFLAYLTSFISVIPWSRSTSLPSLAILSTVKHTTCYCMLLWMNIELVDGEHKTDQGQCFF